MKLSVGRWEHMDVPGHDPKELWQKYTGSKGWHAWTSDHVGEVNRNTERNAREYWQVSDVWR
jgi:hypothetical protein